MKKDPERKEIEIFSFAFCQVDDANSKLIHTVLLIAFILIILQIQVLTKTKENSTAGKKIFQLFLISSSIGRVY